MQAADRVPSAPGHKEHFKEYLLERAWPWIFPGNLIAVTSARH